MNDYYADRSLSAPIHNIPMDTSRHSGRLQFHSYKSPIRHNSFQCHLFSPRTMNHNRLLPSLARICQPLNLNPLKMFKYKVLKRIKDLDYYKSSYLCEEHDEPKRRIQKNCPASNCACVQVHLQCQRVPPHFLCQCQK